MLLKLAIDMTKFNTLVRGIINLSNSKNWDEAKDEWELVDIYFSNEPERCLCSHYPIIEICVLRNSQNCNDTIVGNCCVKKFLGMSSDKLFNSIRNVKKDNKKSFNREMLEHALKKNWINDWEFTFYNDVKGKRNLTEKQKIKKIQINEKILNKINEFGK